MFILIHSEIKLRVTVPSAAKTCRALVWPVRASAAAIVIARNGSCDKHKAQAPRQRALAFPLLHQLPPPNKHQPQSYPFQSCKFPLSLFIAVRFVLHTGSLLPDWSTPLPRRTSVRRSLVEQTDKHVTSHPSASAVALAFERSLLTFCKIVALYRFHRHLYYIGPLANHTLRTGIDTPATYAMLFTSFLVATAALSSAVFAQNETLELPPGIEPCCNVDPNRVPSTLRGEWCTAQRETCPRICGGVNNLARGGQTCDLVCHPCSLPCKCRPD